MLIRPLAAHDLPDVLVLNNANVPELNELDPAAVARLSAMAEVALVAEVEGRFAGFCWTMGPGCDYESLNYRWFSERYADFAYLDRIAVDPALRRFGIGRAFYGELTRRFTGVRPVILCEVNLRPRNDASLHFHQRLGFVEVGQQHTDGGAKTVSLLAMALPAQPVS